jgi:hypothetical protein
LFVSHNLASIKSLTTRTVVLSAGKLIFDGSTAQGVARYVQENLVDPGRQTKVAEIKRPFAGLDRKLEFVDLRIDGLTESGAIADDQPLQLIAAIRCHDESTGFIIGMTIYSEDKDVIGSTFTAVVASPVPGATEEYRFSADLPLAPGRYHCSISISDAKSDGRQIHDSLAEVLPFSVELAATDCRGWKAAWGAVRLPELVRLS